MHRSIATIDSPEFINLTPLDISPMMSKCEIKVFYLGGNRNHSYISKEVATEMAKTLRGAPIVGYYKEEAEDYRDHGEQLIWDDEGIHFNCLTKPYGFVAPDAEVWFQKFKEEDSFGNEIEREYLMTTGYLWTGQYEEANLPIKEGRPHSMELDNDTLEGNWEVNPSDGIEYFIINDAMISKLCILGEDVEPCFEGSSVKAPEVSASFTKSDKEEDFMKQLFTMMRDLKFALDKGGQSGMEKDKNFTDNTEELVEDTQVVDNAEETVEEVEDNKAPESQVEENADAASEGQEGVQEEDSTEETPADSEFVKKDKDKDDEDKDNQDDTTDDQDSDDNQDDNNDDDEEDKKKRKASKNSLALEEELEEIKAQYADLEAKYNELVEFKNQVDNEKKDELIDSFYMLSDEDKKDVIENKSKYSLEEIKSKLAIICFDKKVNFDLDDSSKNEEKVEDNKDAVTFTIDNQDNSLPAWIKAVVNNRNKE